MDVTQSKLGILGGTSYVELPINHRSAMNVRDTKNNYCSIWCNSNRLHPAKANVSLKRSYVKQFSTININGKNWTMDYKSKPSPY